MKSLLTGLGMLAVLGTAALAEPSSPQLPKIKFTVSWIFDLSLGELAKKPLLDFQHDSVQSYRKEMYSRRKQIEKAWNKRGPRLLRKLVTKFGVPFPKDSYQFVLTKSGLGSISCPLTLDVTELTKDGEIDELEVVDVIFSLLMFKYTQKIDLHDASLFKDRKDLFFKTRYWVYFHAIKRQLFSADQALSAHMEQQFSSRIDTSRLCREISQLIDETGIDPILADLKDQLQNHQSDAPDLACD